MLVSVLQAAINRDDHETAIADYQHCAARVGAAGGWPGEPPQAVLQARLQAVHIMKAAWAEEASE